MAVSDEERPYHHGDLPNALKAAAIEVIHEKGLAGFSLREVARRAGVSHAAPGHHFGSAAGLLAALATDGFELLTANMIEARDAEADPIERLVATGNAYVATAVEHPALSEVMFRSDLFGDQDASPQAAGERAYNVLLGALTDVRTARNPDLDVELAAAHCWSLAQGLVTLYPSMVARSRHEAAPALAPLTEFVDAVFRQAVRGLAPA